MHSIMCLRGRFDCQSNLIDVNIVHRGWFEISTGEREQHSAPSRSIANLPNLIVDQPIYSACRHFEVSRRKKSLGLGDAFGSTKVVFKEYESGKGGVPLRCYIRRLLF